MLGIGRKEAGILFLGDILIYFVALWFALGARHLVIPSESVYLLHLHAFWILFLVWSVVFYIAGLYEKHTLVFRGRLPNRIFIAQVVNSFLAVLFFYAIPFFSITPKTVLFLYLLFSFILLLLWRLYGVEQVLVRKKQNALLVGSPSEMHDLLNEVNDNSRYRFRFVSTLDLESVSEREFKNELVERIRSDHIAMVVIDLKNEKLAPMLPALYKLLFHWIYFYDLHRVYEETFDRIPLSLINYSWFLENASSVSHKSYDILKRVMDIGISFIFGLLSLLLYPFIALAIKLDDGGSVFLRQERIGRNNIPILLYKFRTMEYDDGGKWNDANGKNMVTRVGHFLRRTRIDELPQLWNVLFGDISLIGPRPEFPEAVKEYNEKLPYYNVRHLVKPGLSGWAQTHHVEHPHHVVDVDETRRKLSYDLYYIKNHSLALDVKIALQTIRILLSHSGR